MRQLIALVALALALPTAAQAQTAVAVLGLEPLDAPEEIASLVTQALRQRVAQARATRLVSGKPLAELKLVFGCLDESPTCMAHIGSSLNAERLLYGSVRKLRGGYAISLKYLDIPRQRIEIEQSFPLHRGDANAAGIRTAAENWLATLTGIRTATIRLTSTVAGAQIYFDDRAAGTTSTEPTTLADLEPGRHAVRLEAKGYKTFTAIVRLGAGEALDMTAPLEKQEETPVVALTGPTGPTGPFAPVAESPGRSARIAFWSTLGAGVVVLTVAIVAAAEVSHYASLKQDQQTKDCPAVLPVGFEYRCIQNEDHTPVRDLCAEAAKHVQGDTPRNAAIVSYCNSGKAWSSATYILIPVAAALGLTSAYFGWSGYLKARPSEGRGANTAQLRPRLRFTPVVQPGLTAIGAEVRF
jgi:hypothetical protein